MKLSRQIFSIFCFIFLASSCTNYIDKIKGSKEYPVKDGDILYYKDSNVLTYQPKIKLKMDKTILYPKSFILKFPKNLKFYEWINASDFIFYFNKNQVMCINIDWGENAYKGDTSYIATEKGVNQFLQSNYMYDHNKYSITKISYKKERKNFFIKKNNITVLLYNITPQKVDAFLGYLNEFRFTN